MSGDVTKLPKWAQRKIKNLETHIADLEHDMKVM